MAATPYNRFVEFQKQQVPTRASNSTPATPSSSAVHLDLHDIGKQLATGVTYEVRFGFFVDMLNDGRYISHMHLLLSGSQLPSSFFTTLLFLAGE